MAFYASKVPKLTLTAGSSLRPPQIGAIGALAAHWSLGDSSPALISLPTGSGKTGVGLIAPFLMESPPSRVLVVVPSRHLRRQIADAFRTQKLLVELGGFGTGVKGPRTLELTGRPQTWGELKKYEVIVGIPASISPVYYEDPAKPPADLFDLVVVDEAHHVPAESWSALIDHFLAPNLFLTATPIRRDKKRIPGRLLYHYPLRRALEEGLYQPINPSFLPYQEGQGKELSDRAIAASAAALLKSKHHGSSTLLVKAQTVVRLKELSALYDEHGVSLELLYNRLPEAKQEQIIKGLRAGSVTAVGVVGMLGEGFDLPSFRIVAYHDKHKSLPATVQLLGRLARTHPDYPQQAELVTVLDADVYPELKGAVKELYSEDEGWAEILPGLIDVEIETAKQDREFIDALPSPVAEFDPTRLYPLKRSVIFEWPSELGDPLADQVVTDFSVGDSLAGKTIIYSAVHDEGRLLILGLRGIEQPRWSSDPSLLNTRYEVALLAIRTPSDTNDPVLVFLNTESVGIESSMLKILDSDEKRRLIDPDRLSRYVDGLDRVSVSSVGVRSTSAANRGRASYKNYMGSGVDRGLRSIETRRTALGHVMLQMRTDVGTTTGGAALEKGKLWVTRYDSLRSYSTWIDETALRLWSHGQSGNVPLLPGIERGRRLLEWPNTALLAVELNPVLLGQGFLLWDAGSFVGPLEDLDLFVANDPDGVLEELPRAKGGLVRIIGVLNDRDEDARRLVWDAMVDVSGRLDASKELGVTRGSSAPATLSYLLEQFVPTIYFLDGTTTAGVWRYDSRTIGIDLDFSVLDPGDWAGVDLTAETRDTAANREPPAVSVHERLESLLLARTPRLHERWIVCNDGAGEIADYLVIEPLSTGEISLELWHAKAAGGKDASLRIKDVQEVVSQAIRSRHHFTSRSIWAELAERLNRDARPIATLVEGSSDSARLRGLLGLDEVEGLIPWTQTYPSVHGTVGLVQPGLSREALRVELETGSPSTTALAIRELLTTFIDGAMADGSARLLVSS